MYRMKHIPTGLYFQPCKHRSSHLSKNGKVYQTNTNGVEMNKGEHKTFDVWCQKNSRIHKETSAILNWESSNYNEMIAKTDFKDWIREEI